MPQRLRWLDMSASRLFDSRYYAAQTGLAADLGSCVEHYVRDGAAAGYSPHPLFDPAAYLADNPEVAKAAVDPFFHLMTRGAREGRRTSLPGHALASLETLSREQLMEPRISEQARALGWVRTQPSHWAGEAGVVFTSSLGSPHFSRFGDWIADALRADGVIVYRLDQNSERPETAAFDLVVAPHEFFELGAGGSRRLDLDRPLVLLNTARPGTADYFLALARAHPKAVLLDVNPQSAVLQVDSGATRGGHLPLVWGSEGGTDSAAHAATHAPIGPRASGSGPRDARARPIDVLFAGTLTPRRSQSLAYLAPTLAKYRCVIHAPTDTAWDRAAARRNASFKQLMAVAQKTAVLLCLHPDDLRILSWDPVVTKAVEYGALVLAESCLTYPGLEPERHFLMADLGRLPETINLLLSSAQGQEQRTVVARRAAEELPLRFDLRAELRALAFLVTQGSAARA